jgi:L-amino acid N-acyltransferase YncA
VQPADNPGVEIRAASDDDWPFIWPFYRAIVEAGETYAIDPQITEQEGRRQWMQPTPGATFVAVDDDGFIVGSASVYPNRPTAGAHVASASFMVDPDRSGGGVGRALAEHVIDWTRHSGFRSMQFNAVVETNTRAVALWKSLGFDVLATVPEAFLHPTEGYVGLLIMYRRL